MLYLVIANKNYSSWSLRAWALMRELGIEFDEVLVKFHSPEWERQMPLYSPSGLVPVLWEGEPGEGFFTNDTLAIAERLNELYPTIGVWPKDIRARSRARSLYAEFHSGFHGLRSAMPMNIQTDLAGKGHTEEALNDIQTICDRWLSTRQEFGIEGPYLFGEFSAVDACYLPVASRLRTYGVAVNDECETYVDTLLSTVSMTEWSAAAFNEADFVPEDEPYRTMP